MTELSVRSNYPVAPLSESEIGRRRNIREYPLSFMRFSGQCFVFALGVRICFPSIEETTIEDVVQQVFLVIHRRLRDFEHRSSLKTWVFAILLRVVQEHRRVMRRKSPHLMSEPIDPSLLADTSDNPYDALAKSEALRTVEELLATLDEDKRIAFILSELEGMTAHEVAEATGAKVKTVHSRLRAARIEFELGGRIWRAGLHLQGVRFTSSQKIVRAGHKSSARRAPPLDGETLR